MTARAIALLLLTAAALAACSGELTLTPEDKLAETADPAYAASADWSKATAIQIFMSSYYYNPDAVEMRVGTPYHLIVKNASQEQHSFTAPEFFSAVSVRSAGMTSGLTVRGIELDGGQSVIIDLVPVKAGTYSFDCIQFMHATMGMRGRIAVH
jgi:uncharacterized cupredoxin-like copper-binding protein